tara:strand:- start:21 stop:140 length:120 start_codon:yes stop_codon:yes gene_type:complete
MSKAKTEEKKDAAATPRARYLNVIKLSHYEIAFLEQVNR